MQHNNEQQFQSNGRQVFRIVLADLSAISILAIKINHYAVEASCLSWLRSFRFKMYFFSLNHQR